jgi:hypothetical protein
VSGGWIPRQAHFAALKTHRLSANSKPFGHHRVVKSQRVKPADLLASLAHFMFDAVGRVVGIRDARRFQARNLGHLLFGSLELGNLPEGWEFHAAPRFAFARFTS